MPEDTTEPGAALMSRISEALTRLVRLRTVTAVGRVGADDQPAPDAPRIVTTLDLLQGDVTTVIDPSFLEPGGRAIFDFHAQREQQGAAVVERNVAALRALITLAAKVKEAR